MGEAMYLNNRSEMEPMQYPYQALRNWDRLKKVIKTHGVTAREPVEEDIKRTRWIYGT
jgi:hypothetical protein